MEETEQKQPEQPEPEQLAVEQKAPALQTEQPELSQKEYINLKNKAFKEAAAAGKVSKELSWTVVWTEILTGILIGLSHSQIDIYTADFKYDILHMEILKFALFAGINKEAFIQLSNPELSPEEMLRILFYSKEVESFDGAKASIKSLMDELDAIKKEKKEEIPSDVTELKEQIEVLNASISSLTSENAALKEKLEKQAPAAEGKEAASDPEQSEPEQEPTAQSQPELEQKQPEQAAPKSGKKEKSNHAKKAGKPGRFKKNKNKPQLILKKEPLPPDFDLSEYLINASLASDQLELISFAVQKEIDLSTIKQIIDSKIPADQMKSVIKVILTKRAMEEKKEKKEHEQSDNK